MRDERGRFVKGHSTWNKGKTDYKPTGRAIETQFKKGNKPANHKPVGTIRVNDDGYLEIKVREGINQWRLLHREIYKQRHGAYPPKGHALIFKDGDRTNIDPDNLQLVTRRELMQKNTLHNLPEPIKKCIALKVWISRIINGSNKHGTSNAE